MYNDPKIRNAFRKAIKHYFADHGLAEMDKLGPRKYNKKYFDGLEQELTGEKSEPMKSKKKGKDV